MDSAYAVLQSEATIEVMNGFAHINVTMIGKFGMKHTLVFLGSSGINVTYEFEFEPCGPGQKQVDATMPFCTTCDQETYSPNYNGVCLPCPSGATCKDGLIYALEDHRLIYLENNTVEVYACPNSYCKVKKTTLISCLTSIFKASQECYPHRHGWLCEKCDEGYVAFGKSCVECTHTNGGFVVLFLVVIFLLVGILMIFSGRVQSGYPKIFMYFLQIISLLVRPLQSWLVSFIDVFTAGISSADVCLTPVDFYGKVAVKVCIIFLFKMS